VCGNVWTFLTVKFQISANISPPDPPSVFSSLSSGVVPAFCKKAVIEPLIKKAGLESTNVSNYHPISKSFYLKILETTGIFAATVFSGGTWNLRYFFQSGFKAFHSTESALLKFFDVLFLMTDSGDSAILMLLDLTAAFDTVGHTFLLSCLENCVGVRGTALKGLQSYLSLIC